MMMMENGSTNKKDSDKSLTLRFAKSKGSQDRKSFTFGRASKNKWSSSTGIVPPTSIAGQSSSSLDEAKENNSIDGESVTSNSKDTLPSEEKFAGQGITFKAKLIGVDPVTGPRGDKMCQSALQRLKALIKETGSHKQRIIIRISLEGVTIKDEKSGETISSYSIPLISYIARDASDKRAFGFVYGSPDTGHSFIGIKTEKSAIPVMKTIGELFTHVYEKKKRTQSVDSNNSGDVNSDGDMGQSTVDGVKHQQQSTSGGNKMSSSLFSSNQEANPPPLPPPRNESAAFETNGNAFTANFDDAFMDMSNLKDVIASAKQASDPYANWESFDDEFNSSLEALSRSKSSRSNHGSLPVIPSPPTGSPGRSREAVLLKIKPPANNSRKNKSGPSSVVDGPSFANFAHINDPSASFDGSAKSLSSKAASQSSLDQVFRESISSRFSVLSESEQHQLKQQFQQLQQQQSALNSQQMNALFNSSFSSQGGNSFGSPSSGSLANSFSSSGAGLFTGSPANQLSDSFGAASAISKTGITNKINFANVVSNNCSVASPSASIFGSPANNSVSGNQAGTSVTSSPAISSMANSATPVSSPYNGAGINIRDNNINANNSNNSNASSSGDRYAVFSEIHSMTSSIFDKLAEEKKKQEEQEAHLQKQQQQLAEQQHHLQQAKLQHQKLLAMKQQYDQQQLALQQQQLLHQQQINQNQAAHNNTEVNGFNPNFEAQFANTPTNLNFGAHGSSNHDLTHKTSSSSSIPFSTPPQPSRPESQKSNDPFEMSSIFADLDPLGVGKEKPLRDKSEFFQELKSQQKKQDAETQSVGSVDSSNLGKESDPFNIPTELLTQAHLTHLNQHHQAHIFQQQQLLQQAQQQQQQAMQLQHQHQTQLQLQHQQQLQLQQQQLQLRQQQLHHINPHLQLQHQQPGLSSVGYSNSNSFHLSASPTPQTLSELRPSSSASAASRNPFLSDTQSESSDDLFANSPILSSPIPTAGTVSQSASGSIYPSSSSSALESAAHANRTINRFNSCSTNVSDNSNNSITRSALPPSTTSTPPPLPITALKSTTVTAQPHNLSFPLSKTFNSSTRKLSFDSEVFQPNWSSLMTNSGASSDENAAVAAVLGNATAMITTTSMIISGNSNLNINPSAANAANLSDNASIVNGIVNNPVSASTCNNVIESIVSHNRSITPLSIDSRSSRSPSSLSNPRFSELSSSSNVHYSPYVQTDSFIVPSLENLSPLPPPRPPPREFHDTSNSSQSTSRDGSPPPPVPPRPMKSEDSDMPPPPLPKRKISNPNMISSISLIQGEIGMSFKPSANPFNGSSESKYIGSVQPPETFAPPLPLPQRKVQSRTSSLKGFNTSPGSEMYINSRQHQNQYQKISQMQLLNPQSNLATSQLTVTPTTSMMSVNSSSGMYDPFDCAFVASTLQLTDASRISNVSPRPNERSSPRPGLTDGSFSVNDASSSISNIIVGNRQISDNFINQPGNGLDEAKLSRASSYSSDSIPPKRLNFSTNSYEAGKHLDRFSTPLSTFGDSVGKPFSVQKQEMMNVNQGLNSSNYSGEHNLQTHFKSTPQLSQISNITRTTPGFIDSFSGELSFASEDANNSFFEPWKPLSSIEKSSLTEAISRSSPLSGSGFDPNSTGGAVANNGDPTSQRNHGNVKGYHVSNEQTGSGRNPSPFNHFGEEHISPPERNIFRKESDPFADDFFQPDSGSS